MTLERLQSLLYLAQEAFLIERRRPLFEEDFVIYPLLPVVEAVQRAFVGFRMGEIRMMDAIYACPKYPEVVLTVDKSLLTEVCAFYQKYTTEDLIKQVKVRGTWSGVKLTAPKSERVISSRTILFAAKKRIHELRKKKQAR